jgi:hypothetical protein
MKTGGSYLAQGPVRGSPAEEGLKRGLVNLYIVANHMEFITLSTILQRTGVNGTCPCPAYMRITNPSTR